MKKYLYLLPIIAVVIVGMVECKNDDSTFNAEPEMRKVPTEGDVLYSELLKDGKLIEQCIDSLVNLGDEAHPAYFYINTSHKVNDVELGKGEAGKYSFFYSVTKEELDEFISQYAQVQSLSASATLSEQDKISAYQHLSSFLQTNNIDAARLVSITGQNPELLSQTLECGKLVPVKNNDSIPYCLPEIPERLKPYLPTLTSESFQDCSGLTSEHIVLMRDGLQLPFHIDIDDGTQTTAEPDPYNKNTYVSYINEKDRLSENYYDTKYFDSSVYTCRYGAKGCPMVNAEFYIQCWYASKHKGDVDDILYVPYLKTMISDAHKGLSMKLEGSVTYNNPLLRQTGDGGYAVVGGGEVVIDYGDSWAVERTGRLKFTVDGETGYHETSWNSNE